MRISLAACFMILSLGLAAPSSFAQDFKFSDDDKANAEQAAQATKSKAKVQTRLAAPCKDEIKNQKIMVVMGEEKNGKLNTAQSSYNHHLGAINQRLQALGLRTYTQEEIQAQVQQSEIDAFFKNDPNAAINASKRLAAQYILRGLITSSVRRNAIIDVNEVRISMDFTLTGANGKQISRAGASNASYAGGMALTLIQEVAGGAVAKLYSDYCRRGEPQ